MTEPERPLDRTRRAVDAIAHETPQGGRCYWSLLYDVPEIIGTNSFRYDETAHAILATAITGVSAERGLLFFFDKNRDLVVPAAIGLPRDLDPMSPLGARIARAIDDALRTDQVVSGTLGADGNAAYLAAPLHARIRDPEHRVGGLERRRFPRERLEKQLGAIYIDRPQSRVFRAEDADLYRVLVAQAASLLVLARLHEVAGTDPLTGLHTREELEQVLQVEMTVATHTNVPLALALFEIDRFDEHANRLGRRIADATLAEVATRVRTTLRKRDAMFRHGVGKLIALFAGADEDGAVAAATRAIVAARAAHHPEITVSAGISVFPNHGEHQGDLVKKADQALFLAESGGGDRATLWSRAISRHALRTDKLLGIITGDPRRDYRNVLLLLDAIAVVNSVHDRRHLLSTILDMLIELTATERGILFLPGMPPAARPGGASPSRVVTVTKAGETVRLEPAIAQDAKKRQIQAEDYCSLVVKKVADSGVPVSILDYQGEDDPTVGEEVKDLGLRTVVCVALQVGRRLAGVLYVDARTVTREVVEADLIFFQALAREVGVALENARLYEETVRARKEVEDLNQKLAAKVETQAHELEETREFLEVAEVELKTKYDYGRIVGKSERMQTIYRMLDRITDTEVPVLVHGESGTGKELVAKAIHYNGPRKRKRFVSVNCAAISPTLLESELFGHVRGAFTGADRDKPGLFEQADQGTIFLDEVQDMPANMQRELLRVLQEHELRRVGGKDMIKVDVRVISATNRDLKDMMRKGAFREDLYYRLNVVTLDLPPLRDRPEDIPLLVERHLAELCKAQRRTPVRVTRRAIRKLLRCNFSGNVRELHNMLERALLMVDGDILDEQHFDIEVTTSGRLRAMPVEAPGLRSASDAPLVDPGIFHLPYKQAADAFKAEYLRRLLERHAGNVTRASEESGLVRSSLHKIMRKLEVDARPIRKSQ